MLSGHTSAGELSAALEMPGLFFYGILRQSHRPFKKLGVLSWDLVISSPLSFLSPKTLCASPGVSKRDRRNPKPRGPRSRGGHMVRPHGPTPRPVT